MRPFLIVDRCTIERELADFGYNSSNCYLVHSENAFMTKTLFELWGEKVFRFGKIAQRKSCGLAWLRTAGLICA
jgi:hypothetical protein